MQTKTIIILFTFVGMILIITNLIIQQTSSCPPTNQIVYKYIPRTFEEEQDEPVYPSDIFKTMFTEQSPWVRSVQGADSYKTRAINKFFVSQY